MNLSEPLLEHEENSNKLQQLCLILSLPFIILCSACGMMLLKSGEQSENVIVLITGFTLEGFAFALYPVSMRFYPLRLITVCWGGGSILTAIAGGWFFFNEVPSRLSMIGSCFVFTGMMIVSNT